MNRIQKAQLEYSIKGLEKEEMGYTAILSKLNKKSDKYYSIWEERKKIREELFKQKVQYIKG